MNKNTIVIIVAILFALGARIYKYYMKKNKNDSGSVTRKSDFASSSKDEDYEPYSKK